MKYVLVTVGTTQFVDLVKDKGSLLNKFRIFSEFEKFAKIWSNSSSRKEELVILY